MRCGAVFIRAIMKREFEELYENLVYVTQEMIIKTGDGGPIGLYYTLPSIRRIFGKDLTADEAGELLKEFSGEANETLTDLAVTAAGERFCFTVGKRGVEYVAKTCENGGFLKDLINLLKENPTCDEDRVVGIFKKYSDDVIVENSDEEEFDRVIRFGGGKPDGLYYCFKFDGDHTHYHRLTEKDYLSFGFGK